MGPGGLNRKRAGFEVRDVHISHYGRICPIETPEGTNIGLIASLSIYSDIDEYGFLITPYRVVKDGKVNGEHKYLRADEEMKAILAPPDVVEKDGQLRKGLVLARVQGDLATVPSKEVQYVDISPRQTVSVSAALIPFLEHDDANRALMGSNMQRQAVPLLRTDPPIVSTGMERPVAQNSGMVVRAERGGVITYVDSSRILIDNADEYVLRKFVGLNERTCLNQKPIVKKGQRVKKGQIIADGAATHQGELALGRNVLVAFMTFDGYNFEDAIVISQRLVKEDIFTSIHIEEYDVEIRETKLGREEFTRDIPNVSRTRPGESRRKRRRPSRHPRRPRRHPRRQDRPQEQERTDPGRKTAARDLRPRRRRREERFAGNARRRRGRRHRHPALQPPHAHDRRAEESR